MGQAESTATSNDESPRDNSKPPSMESLIAEAVAHGGDDENESLDAKARKALDCPCISHLRNGACGSEFSEAFLCFLKSSTEEKGSDCVNPFVMLQSCIKAHPDAFSKDELEGEEAEREANPSPETKIIPPRWSVDAPDSKSKL